MYSYAVFQGGGVKGIALVGALGVAEKNGVTLEGVGGASAGAIVAALYAAGYSADEMQLILEAVDFDALLDSSGWAPWALYRRQGLYRGQKLQEWIHGLLAKRGVRLFKDCKRRLRVVATDLTSRTLVVLDAERYPEMEVSEAIRMSMSIPFVFEPRRIGEHLMVDGGVLSNFPLSLFDANLTLGFRLRQRSEAMAIAPSGARDFVLSVVGTLLDGRDNYEFESTALGGLIEIDPGTISSTQFKLAAKQKSDLYERGVSAASKFFLASKRASVGPQLSVVGAGRRVQLDIPPKLHDDTEVRFSISALVRIECNGELLLVKGNRIDQYQPVGGVLKIYQDAKATLAKMGVKDDSKLPMDSDSFGDLRVFVPWRSASAFIQWYLQGAGRETSPWREFYEELVHPAVVTSENFRTPAFDRIGNKASGVRWSEHFQCYEVLIAEIFALVLTPKQAVELEELRKRADLTDVMWASPALIRARGHDETKKSQPKRISEHSAWLLDATP